MSDSIQHSRKRGVAPLFPFSVYFPSPPPIFSQSCLVSPEIVSTNLLLVPKKRCYNAIPMQLFIVSFGCLCVGSWCLCACFARCMAVAALIWCLHFKLFTPSSLPERGREWHWHPIGITRHSYCFGYLTSAIITIIAIVITLLHPHVVYLPTPFTSLLRTTHPPVATPYRRQSLRV